MPSKPQTVSFNALSVELRLLIWHSVYDLQSPRFVQIQTTPHEDCKSHNEGFCPRWSPSPAPVMVNICQESRRIAYEIATERHHLFFSTSPSGPIFYNPEVDTLYVPDEKATWIRGPDGILTQLKTELILQAYRVRRLAADLNPYGLQEGSIKADFKNFPGIQDYILLVTELKDGDLERFKAADRVLQILKARDQRRFNLGSATSSMVRHEYPDHLKFAVKQEGILQFVEEAKFEEGN